MENVLKQCLYFGPQIAPRDIVPEAYDGSGQDRFLVDEMGCWSPVTEQKNVMKTINGTYEVKDGKLDFKCITQGVTFAEVQAGLRMLRDELNRQLANSVSCPYHKTMGIISAIPVKEGLHETSNNDHA